MFPSSLAVIITGLLLGAAALIGFAWAWYVRAFDGLDRQAGVIFDPRDLRLRRPWESPQQSAERVRAYGQLLEADGSEWGGPIA